MKKRNLKSLKLKKEIISNLENPKGGMIPPPPPTLAHTCVGPPGHAVCPYSLQKQYTCYLTCI